MTTIDAQVQQLRTITVSRALESVTSSYFGTKAASWKTKHVTELVEAAFDAALAFGFVQGVAATAIDRKSHLVGYWIDGGRHTDNFETEWQLATKLLKEVVNFRMSTMLAATGGTRMAVASAITEEVLDNIHMDDLFIAKPVDFFNPANH